MRIVFVSNYLTHHQIPVCEQLFQKLGNDFRFISTSPMEKERTNMGWSVSASIQYEVRAYLSADAMVMAKTLLQESDVAIIGACPPEWLNERMKTGDDKITFLYGERIFKNSNWQAISPGAFRYRLNYLRNIKNRKVYMLCASAFLAADLKLMGIYKNRCYRWGYFPEFIRNNNIHQLIQQKKKHSILWCGRLLHWKHPEEAVEVAAKLKSAGLSFEMKIIGDGEMKPILQQMMEQYQLQDCVQLHGFMSPTEVRKQMECADIFLFTSDRYEGWGAVLNESMNAGCAVIANREIGSAPYLVEDGVNGLLYDRRKKDDLFSKIQLVLKDQNKKSQMQYNAYQTMAALWNPESAANRFMRLAERLMNQSDTEFTDGPCSKAPILNL